MLILLANDAPNGAVDCTGVNLSAAVDCAMPHVDHPRTPIVLAGRRR